MKRARPDETKKPGRPSTARGRALDELTIEEAERRIRMRPTLLESLTPEDLAVILAYDGPEIAGRGGPRRKDRRPAQ